MNNKNAHAPKQIEAAKIIAYKNKLFVARCDQAMRETPYPTHNMTKEWIQSVSYALIIHSPLELRIPLADYIAILNKRRTYLDGNGLQISLFEFGSLANSFEALSCQEVNKLHSVPGTDLYIALLEETQRLVAIWETEVKTIKDQVMKEVEHEVAVNVATGKNMSIGQQHN